MAGARPADDLPELGRLAEHRGAAGVVADAGGQLRTQDLPDVGFGVGAHQGQDDAGLVQLPDQGRGFREQGNLRGVLGNQPPGVPGDEGHLPGRHAHVGDHLAARPSPQHGDFVIGDLPEAELARDLVGHADEPVGAVGKGAVEVEDDEPIGQSVPSGGRKSLALPLFRRRMLHDCRALRQSPGPVRPGAGHDAGLASRPATAVAASSEAVRPSSG